MISSMIYCKIIKGTNKMPWSFSEMERDSLIAHGGSAFIKETFFDMSDVYQVNVCEKCGGIVSSVKECRACKKTDIAKVNIPYCTKLLFQELQAMGVSININVK